jgi:hypothetical protein
MGYDTLSKKKRWDMTLISFYVYRRVDQNSRNPKRRLVLRKQMPRREIEHLVQHIVPNILFELS